MQPIYPSNIHLQVLAIGSSQACYPDSQLVTRSEPKAPSLANFPYIYCSIGQRVFTLGTCCGYRYGRTAMHVCHMLFTNRLERLERGEQ